MTARKKSFLSLLLTLCVAAAPMHGLAASEPEHTASMTVGCVDCDMHDGGTSVCDESGCPISSGFCAAQNLTSPLPTSWVTPAPWGRLIDGRRSASIDYRSHLEFSIYRPPIA